MAVFVHGASVFAQLDEKTSARTEAAELKKSAVTAAREVAEAYPDDPLTYALLGAAFYNNGQSEDAARHLKKCLELRPALLDAYEILARIAYEKGETEEAIRLCQEALKHGKATTEILNRLGRSCIDLGKTDDAIRALQQAVNLPRATAESSYLLGQAWMQGGEFANAKEAFLRATALVPDHTQAYFGLFTACQRLGQTDEAMKFRDQFQKLEEIDRKALTERSGQEDTLAGLPQVRETTARTFFGVAQVYLAHKRASEGAGLLRKCAALAPESPSYRAALEQFYIEQKAPAEGVKVFEGLATEQPGNGLNYFFLGRLQAFQNQIDAAERSFGKVQELAPSWAEGYRVLADLHLRTNRKLDQARVLARKAVELEPTAAHYYILAAACDKNKDRPGAIEAMEKAVALDPGEKRYQQVLAQLRKGSKP